MNWKKEAEKWRKVADELYGWLQELDPDPGPMADYMRDDRLATFVRQHYDLYCADCERCTWNPSADCGKADHPHCEVCGHCQYRHAEQSANPDRFTPVAAAG